MHPSPLVGEGLGMGGFGVSGVGRYLVVSHTERGLNIRMISARLMTKSEKVIYEQG
ncbi:BrnT family toxin [Candidatus Thiothrix anitrata]|uniref:BrnT family toxin n=1 Tax=Candidatus Thiothrix anitrata TaxID=2823902 RepID=A0ABX7X8S4_9GAMM|nr:BrnT family toxin [Candidatus Thiothrix anitrata]